MTTELEDGILLRSNPETFTLGGTINFKTDFLAAARHMAAPEILWIQVRVSGALTAGAGGSALGRDAAKLVSNLKLTDKDAFVDASGAGLRINSQIELGLRAPDNADLAANGVNNSYVAKVIVPFELPYSQRPRDTRVPLEHFLEGGQIELTCASALPTNWASFTTPTVTIFAKVVDARVRELKSRLVVREQVMSLQEHWYDVYGSIRSLVGHSKLATTGHSSWAAFTTFDSQTLRFPPSVPSDVLIDRYRMERNSLNAADEITLATPGAVAFVVPDLDQKIGAMVDAKTVHIDLKAAPPTSARLLISAIKDRNAELAALVAGYANVSDYQAALHRFGRVVTPGGNKPATAFAPHLVRRFPVRISSGNI